VNVFELEERKAIARDPELSLYDSLTSDQVIGLLDACGNYFARRAGLEPDELPFATSALPDAVAAHRDLVLAYQRVATEGAQSTDDPLVFSEDEQRSLRLHKYVRGCERITHKRLLDLLEAVHAYSLVGTPMPMKSSSRQLFRTRSLGVGMNRYFHAHNWVIRFGKQPFTDAEFVQDLHETVLSQP
jgi:hypothetical protein